MLGRICLVGFSLFVLTIAVEVNTRPKSCVAGTTYKKDCNTCTCAADAGKDKCSQIDCSRTKPSSTTARTPSSTRPGICPTKVTPAPGTNPCANRNTSSNCKIDTDCPGAKKCCEDGCKKNVCRNAIYPNTP